MSRLTFQTDREVRARAAFAPRPALDPMIAEVGHALFAPPRAMVLRVILAANARRPCALDAAAHW